MAFDVESASSEEANESMTATSWQEGRIKRVAVIGAGARWVFAVVASCDAMSGLSIPPNLHCRNPR